MLQQMGHLDSFHFLKDISDFYAYLQITAILFFRQFIQFFVAFRFFNFRQQNAPDSEN